ncbi:DUF4129 domain-containing protein [Ktedonospora formicarum]|uniref:Protein-glutamine gamma-glutamyltransferase-like C-terminal domain-containing protein n=1 Tax=Ktedonospora formicarum TaxID=2778364 RepID=A0A8J3MTF6_9CHLR|nr:DUF4129 domain-containing protein [Ktedonospora formicarum]GHO45881.1 hypothetical protein KSX_40440 [Ktedonospora formicarum]
MSSPTRSTTRRARSSRRVLFTSSWIEVCIIPVASAIMEALPITLALQALFHRSSVSAGDQQMLNAASVTFALLGLHWWMMWSRAKGILAGVVKMRTLLLQLLSFLLAFAFLLWTNPVFLVDVSGWTLILFLTGLLWGRSYFRMRARPDEETDQLLISLKIGFLVMLGVVVFALIEQSQGFPDLNQTLLADFPIFFLSALLALSFKRLSILKQEQSQKGRGSHSLETGRWLVILALVWVAVIIGSILLEALPPDVLSGAVNVLLGILFGILGLFASLLSLLPFPDASQLSSLHGQSRQDHQMPPQFQIKQPPHPTLFSLPISLLIFGGGVLLAVLILTVLLRKRAYLVEEGNEDEMREQLDKEKIRQERRIERKQSLKLEILDPSSARARYREFLTATATQGLPRRPEETPIEYQTRLLSLTQGESEVKEPQGPSDQEILATLTQAYTRERYGAKPLTPERRDYLRQWVPSLFRHFGRKSP